MYIKLFIPSKTKGTFLYYFYRIIFLCLRNTDIHYTYRTHTHVCTPKLESLLSHVQKSSIIIIHRCAPSTKFYFHSCSTIQFIYNIIQVYFTLFSLINVDIVVGKWICKIQNILYFLMTHNIKSAIIQKKRISKLM